MADIFVFDRKVKIISHFNHKGDGPREYIQIWAYLGIVVDEKNEEIIVLDKQKFRFLVYSINGEYKRSLKYSDKIYPFVFYLNNETMLVYNDDIPFQPENYSEKPYMLMSKKDGRIVFSELDIRLPVRYTNIQQR